MNEITEKDFLKRGAENSLVDPSDSKLKNMVVQYVGEITNPKDDEVTVENIVEVFAEEFPEFLMVIAEQNWVNGYSQALSDVEYMKKQKNTTSENE